MYNTNSEHVKPFFRFFVARSPRCQISAVPVQSFKLHQSLDKGQFWRKCTDLIGVKGGILVVWREAVASSGRVLAIVRGLPEGDRSASHAFLPLFFNGTGIRVNPLAATDLPPLCTRSYFGYNRLSARSSRLHWPGLPRAPHALWEQHQFGGSEVEE